MFADENSIVSAKPSTLSAVGTVDFRVPPHKILNPTLRRKNDSSPTVSFTQDHLVAWGKGVVVRSNGDCSAMGFRRCLDDRPASVCILLCFAGVVCILHSPSVRPGVSTPRPFFRTGGMRMDAKSLMNSGENLRFFHFPSACTGTSRTRTSLPSGRRRCRRSTRGWQLDWRSWRSGAKSWTRF